MAFGLPGYTSIFNLIDTTSMSCHSADTQNLDFATGHGGWKKITQQKSYQMVMKNDDFHAMGSNP